MAEVTVHGDFGAQENKICYCNYIMKYHTKNIFNEFLIDAVMWISK